MKSINDDEFVLSYGSGEITVEMDDWRWDSDNAEALRIGERVTVTGNIDDDLFQAVKLKPTTSTLIPTTFITTAKMPVLPRWVHTVT